MTALSKPLAVDSGTLLKLGSSCTFRRLVLTGATGFLGRNALLWRAHGPGEFIALVRSTEQQKAPDRLRQALERCASSYGVTYQPDALAARIKVEEADITKADCGLSLSALARLRTAPVDEVWHFAASLRFAERHRDEIRRHNVEGTRNALALAAKLGARRFVYISTAYTAGTKHGAIAEELHPIEGPFNNVYEETKCTAEHEVVRAAAQWGFSYSILRPSIVIGPLSTHKNGGTTMGLYGFIREIHRLREFSRESGARLSIVGNPETSMNYVPIDHVVRDILHLEQTDFAGGPIFHLTAQHEVSIGKTVERACHHTGTRPIEWANQREADPSPLEQLFDRYAEFYKNYWANTKSFTRSLPFANGLTEHDFDAFVRTYARRLDMPRTELFQPSGARGRDGVPLCTYTAGPPDAPPVVLVNAYGMPVDFWQPMAARLASHRRVITWESRGVPNLAADFDPSQSRPEMHARDMEAVLDHYGIESADVVAWCSGAQVSLDFALNCPSRVKRLALLSGSYCLPPSVPRTAVLEDLLTLLPKMAADRRMAAFYCQMIYGGSGESSADRQKLTSILTATDPFLLHMTSAPFRNGEALYRYANLFVEFFKGRELPPGVLETNTLVVTTPVDHIAHPESSVEIARRLPNSRLLRLAAGDHFSMYYDVDLANTVLEFLEEGADTGRSRQAAAQ